MINKDHKRIFDEELEYIASHVIASSTCDAHGRYWVTPTLDGNLNVKTEISPDLYSGAAGIALFYLELFRYRGEAKDFRTVNEILEWLENYLLTADAKYLDHSFYTGRMGIAYMYVLFAQSIHHNRKTNFLKKGIKIAEKTLRSIRVEHGTLVNLDFLTGLSGTLVGAVEIYRVSQSRQILDGIAKIVGVIVSQLRLQNQGLAGTNSPNSARPLCGFSHGAGGIGFALLETGSFFNQPQLIWLARQLFAYEDSQFNIRNSEYPDFRKLISSQNRLKAYKLNYKKGDFSPMQTHGFLTAWCHGSTGIGLIRLRAMGMIPEPSFRKRLAQIISRHNKILKLEQMEPEPYTLCHGRGGTAIFYLECYKHFKLRSYYNTAIKLGLDAAEERRETGKYNLGKEFYNTGNPNLFTGLSGIGYMYLMLLSPERNSILRPDIVNHNRKKTKVKICPSGKAFDSWLLKILLPLTHRYARPIPFAKIQVLNLKHFEKVIGDKITKSKKALASWKFERNIIKESISIPSTLQYVRRLCEIERNLNLLALDGTASTIFRCRLKIPDENRIVSMDFRLPNDGIDTFPGERPTYYLYTSYNAIYPIRLDNISHQILIEVQKRNSLMNFHKSLSTNENMWNLIVSKTKELLTLGFIYQMNPSD